MNKGLFPKSVKFSSFNRIKAVSIIFVFLMILSFFSARVFAAQTNKNFTLYDDDVDSPKVIMKDADEKDFILQKMDNGDADIVNTEGSINLKENDE